MTEEPMSKPQRDLLMKLGADLDFSKFISKKEASDAIKAKLEEKNKDEEFPVVKPGKVAQKGSNVEFHLSPEQVRTNALDLALKMIRPSDIEEIKNLNSDFWVVVRLVESYLNGRN